MASLALSEAYAITGDDRLKPYVQRAVAFSVNAQNTTLGGWRYQMGIDADMSQFGWQVMALKSAQLGGIEIPAQTTDGMQRFLNSCSRGASHGLASYRPGEAESRTMTAEALVCRFFLDSGTDPAAIQEACTFIAQELPGSGKPNLYYWYYATLGLYHAGNEHWQSWNENLKEQLIESQLTSGSPTGSWDPDTVWGGYGGRVYSTAMATLCLEVYYRYLPTSGIRDGKSGTSSVSAP